MNGRKFFFFDIDGTLTTPLTNDYPDSTREAIKELKDNGHFVAIATGRMQADAWEVAKALGICAAVSDGGNALTILHGGRRCRHQERQEPRGQRNQPSLRAYPGV